MRRHGPTWCTCTTGQRDCLPAPVSPSPWVHTRVRTARSAFTRRDPVSVGTAFHPRTSELNTKMVWGEWSGYWSAAVYADFHDIEYNAIREAAAMFDTSPLYKFLISGPDAAR